MNPINSHCQGLGLTLSVALIAAGAFGVPTSIAASQKVPLPRPRPDIHASKDAAVPIARHVPLPVKRTPSAAGASAFAQANVGLHGALFESRAMFKPLARPVSGPFAVAPAAATSNDDIAAVKRVIEAARKGKEAEADAAERSINDPVARKLAEWAILRSDNTNPTFARYAAFVNANPSWPHAPLFRRRAENALWNDHLDDATVLAFFANHKPTTAKGRYMLARALLAKGDREGAAALVRYAWRYEDCSADVRVQGARDVRQPAHARGSQGTHGAPLLRRRHRGRHARCHPARRRRIGNWACPRGGD